MSKKFLIWLVLCLIWGSTWLFIKLGLHDLPPITFAGIRFLIASVVLWLLILWQRRPLPRTRSSWGLIGLTGLLFTFNYGLIFWAEQYISSGLAAVLQAIIPAFGLILAHFHLPAERITLLKALGVGIGIAGVTAIFSDQLRAEGVMALAGSAAIVIGAFSAAYSSVLVKARGGGLDPAVLAGGQMGCGFIALLLIGLGWEGNPVNFHWTQGAIISVCYLAVVGSSLAFLLFYWLVQNMEVTRTMLISLVTPIIAVGLGVLLLHEKLNWRIVAGSLGILAGVGLIFAEKSAGRVRPVEELTAGD